MTSPILSLMALVGVAAAYDPCCIASFPPNEHAPLVKWNLQEYGHAVGNNPKFNLIYAEGFYPAPAGYSGGITVSTKDYERTTFYNTNKPGSNDDLRIGIDPETHSTATLIIQDPWKSHKPIESHAGGTTVFDLECPSTVEYIEFQDTEKLPYITFLDEYGDVLKENGKLRAPRKDRKGIQLARQACVRVLRPTPYTDAVSSISHPDLGYGFCPIHENCPVCSH